MTPPSGAEAELPLSAAASAAVRVGVIRGLVWKFASQVFLEGSRLGVAVVLARLLTPHDYGLAAMATVFAMFVLAFSDLALGAALVQRRELTESDRSTVFWVSLMAGLSFTLLGLATSDTIARFYGQPAVGPLFGAISLCFVVTSLGTTHSALLVRDMRFRSLELRMMMARLIGAAIGIVVALNGFGAWAIIGQQLATATASTLLLWCLSSWRPKWIFSLTSLRHLGAFGGSVFGQRVLYYVTRTADNVVIGRFLGPGALGAYALGYNIMLTPLSRIGVPIAEVMFPALSRLQADPERVGVIWLKVNRLVAAISVPALAGVMVTAPEFVETLLGARWTSVSPVLQVLAWVGILQAVQNLNGEILQALGRAGTALAFTVVWSVTNIAAFVIGLTWGIVGVAVLFAIANTILTPLWMWLTARVTRVSLNDFARNLRGVGEAVIVMALGVLCARVMLLQSGIPAALRLGLLVLCGIVLYVPLVAWRAPHIVADIRSLRAGQ